MSVLQPSDSRRTATQPLLAVRDLAISVPGRDGASRKLAVTSVSMSVHAGQTLAVVGESGSGKSLTALSVLRLVPPLCRIERGAIAFDGMDLLTFSEKRLRSVRGRRIAMIFQEPMSALNPVMTVGAQIVEALRLHLKLSKKSAMQRAAAGLDEVGLTRGVEKLAKYPHELSGGMRQRVMIAMAVACEPALLLADEPTTALDVTIQAQILSLLRNLQKSRGMAMMLIAHDLGVVAQHADVVCVMYQGHVVEYADVLSLFSRPMHPYTRALLQCRPSLESGAARLHTVDELMRQPNAMRIEAQGVAGLTAWWPDAKPVEPMHANEHGVTSTLVEVERGHWVGCWRTASAIKHGEGVPNVPVRHGAPSVVSISASSSD